MYPNIAKNFVIRGTKQKQYLADMRGFSLIPLELEIIASIIKSCDGQNSLDVLAKSHGVSVKEMKAFLKKFEKEGILNFNKEPAKNDILVFLGQNDPWLKEVHIDITSQCNQSTHCRHCFRGDKLNLKKDYGTDDWLRIIDEISSLGTHNIAFSGGEPFLRSDLLQIIESVIKHKMFVSAIFTNGTIQSKTVEDVVSLLINHKIGTTFYISLDGLNPELHDANRGIGSFAKTIKFIRYLAELRKQTKASFKISINSQVTSENVKTLKSWYKFISELEVDRWRLTSGRVTGRLSHNINLLPFLEELFIAYQELIRENIADHKKGKPLLLNVESFFNTHMIDDKVAYTFSEETSICDYKENSCSIEPNGDVQFCTSWGEKKFGNVFVEGIAKIWQSVDLQILKKMKVGDINDCQGCRLLKFCGGGCRLVAEKINGRDFYSCERYRYFETHILPILLAEKIIFTSEKGGL